MSYGMSYDDFWHGDPAMVIAYREANAIRQEEMNVQAWLQGLYIYKAFSVVLDNAFAKRGTPPQEYLKHPLDIKEPSRAEEIIQAGKNRAKMVASLNALQASWEKNGGTDGGS